MKATIMACLNDSVQLERLYRSDPKRFETDLRALYPQLEGHPAADFWLARLDAEQPLDRNLSVEGWQVKNLLKALLMCLVVGLLIKLPAWAGLSVNEEYYYFQNGGLILLIGLLGYNLLTRNRLSTLQKWLALGAFAVTAVYINLLPSDGGDAVKLVFIHAPILLWFIYGLVYIDFNAGNYSKCIDFIRFNGDLTIVSAMIALAGGLLTAITMGLFNAINLDVTPLYTQYILVWGAVAVPNVMLLGVMALIIFSVAEASKGVRQRFGEIVLFGLSFVTLIVNLLALSAIIYRLDQFGLTPNRLAVLGSNLLIFGHLMLIMLQLYRVCFQRKPIIVVEQTIAGYLPVYGVWALLVVIGWPLFFNLF